MTDSKLLPIAGPPSARRSYRIGHDRIFGNIEGARTRPARGWLDTVPGFPDRLRENPPRQGFFEHPEYLAVRAHLPAPWQDILDLA